tara:strand:+ start:46 stop:273 length:228 start_codon:yes stop_codon:yes gene_type:complete
MNQDVLRIEEAEVVSRSDQHGVVQLRVTAIVDDMVQTAAAVIYPPDIAEPAQFGPARCFADITVCLDDVQWQIAE